MTNAERGAMPREIRYFWWLSLALVLFWTTLIMLGLDPGLASAERLPEKFRAGARQAAVTRAVLHLLWTGLVLLTAWLVAFSRQGWARYVFVIAILVVLAVPIILAIYGHYGLNLPWSSIIPKIRLDPAGYPTAALLIAAVFFSFSAPARRWFKRSKS